MCNQNKSTELIFVEHEKDKKRNYQQRVIDVEMGSFTPLVFGTNRGMGKAFSKQPSGQTFLPKTASGMPVPYLVLKQAHLSKFLPSVHKYVRCEGPDPLLTRMLTFWMILMLMQECRHFSLVLVCF